MSRAPAIADELVLSLFPGVDLLGRGFEAEGFCVVRGPDILLDSKIEDFKSPPPGTVTIIIGGPPCQEYSDANRDRNPEEGDRLVLEYCRIVHESQPDCFLMENVRRVPTVEIDGYSIQRLPLIDTECGGTQSRLRHIQFGSRRGHIIRPERVEAPPKVSPTVTCRRKPGESHASRCKAQGVDLPLRSFTKMARDRAIGNGVPMTMARVLASAVAARSRRNVFDCVCGCGRVVMSLKAHHATPSCRKRMQRQRDGVGRVLRYEP